MVTTPRGTWLPRRFAAQGRKAGAQSGRGQPQATHGQAAAPGAEGRRQRGPDSGPLARRRPPETACRRGLVPQPPIISGPALACRGLPVRRSAAAALPPPRP
eukprot:scaffold7049_cov202-Prasinococcus_capsulatus_cf.AAC.1